MLGACGFSINTGSSIDATGSDASGSDGESIVDDAPTDGPAPDITTAGWSTPQYLGISNVDDPTLTGDLLQIWFDLNGDIFHATRASIATNFGAATKVAELSSLSAETTPEVSSNGLVMTFARSVGNNDLYISTWDGGSQSWTTPVTMNELNTTDHDQCASISDDRLMLAMTRNPLAGTSDIYISTRTTPSDPWSTPVLETELNTNMHDGSAFLSANKLTICFDSQRVSVQHDIYCAKRVSATVPFDAPVAMTEINSPQSDQDPWISPDGKTLVFWSDRDGTGRLYYSVHP